MAMAGSFQLTCALLLLFSAAVTATDHIVGANRGWNPGINYTLWANNHTFYVGDLIYLNTLYQKNQYNVFEVNQTGYENCTTEGAVGNWSSGKDFIPLNKAKRYYFICGNGQCFNGMKVSVVVHPLPPPPTSAISTQHSNPNTASSPALFKPGLHSLLLSSLLVCFGFVWMSTP
ncbi:Lamin-like protein [Mucuna pruriens]|uniref:Lamin-like protein n=1 Tax=Mucuna pruriens TaxID=157652 RepID=A0A371I8G8_MUCPR|nr:Lamin-like protein [Mucuna pruriens]